MAEDQGLSLVKFCVLNFFAVVIQSRPFQPISTLQVKLVEALLSSEPEPDEKAMARVKWIYENTHKKVNTPLSIVELIVFRNLDKGVNKEIELGDQTFILAELYNYLDEVSKELAGTVISIAKKYSLDFPNNLGNMGNQNNMSFGG